MNLTVWLIISVAIVAAAAPITGGRGARINERELAKLSRKSGLPATDAPQVARSQRNPSLRLWPRPFQAV